MQPRHVTLAVAVSPASGSPCRAQPLPCSCLLIVALPGSGLNVLWDLLVQCSTLG
jgi:hypothetical protein